jgi:hypothetical protein
MRSSGEIGELERRELIPPDPRGGQGRGPARASEGARGRSTGWLKRDGPSIDGSLIPTARNG